MIPDFHGSASLSTILGPAMEIAERDDREEAREYLAQYVAYLRREHDFSESGALQAVKDNIGYYAGYYGPQTREAVRRVFSAEHPIFGGSDRFGRAYPDPSPDELLEMGKRQAERWKS